ncbi:MAG: TolC family protein, partial [Lentisphaeria bacterium]|nr:TolC family protein [Lentisphaeria bacterium]
MKIGHSLTDVRKWMHAGVSIVFLFVSVVAVGQEAPPELGKNASLQDYVLYAEANNAGLQAAHSDWRAAMERIPQVTALPDPKLSYTHYLQEVETRVGAQKQRVTLSQTFPWFGKLRLRGDIAAESAQARWNELEAQRAALALTVKNAYYDTYFLKRSIRVTHDSFELLKSLEIVARERYRTGGALAAVMQAQVELGKLEDRLRSQEEFRPVLFARLNAALSRPVDTEVPWPEELGGAEDVAARAKALVRSLANTNPDLRKLTTLARRESLAAELADRNRLPDITVGLSAIDTGDSWRSGLQGSSDDALMVTVGLNLPIWFGKYRAQRREALARRQALLKRRENQENTLLADAKLALYELEDAERKVGLYRDTLIPKARQSLGVIQQAFQAGKSDFLNLIDAQRMLLEFELSHERSLVARAKQFAKVEMLAGGAAFGDKGTKG